MMLNLIKHKKGKSKKEKDRDKEQQHQQHLQQQLQQLGGSVIMDTDQERYYLHTLLISADYEID